MAYEQPAFVCFVAEETNKLLEWHWVAHAIQLERQKPWPWGLDRKEQHRGKRVGFALYKRFIHYAASLRVKRNWRGSLDWNQPAIDFYEQTGAKVLSDWRRRKWAKTKFSFYKSIPRCGYLNLESVGQRCRWDTQYVSCTGTNGSWKYPDCGVSHGKTTNALEKLIEVYFEDSKRAESQLNEVIDYHLGIMNEIFEHQKHDVFDEVKGRFDHLRNFLKNNKSPHYSFVYDQIVSTGELVSTTIITHYLNSKGISANWLDARECIQTDARYRDANVDWTRQRLSMSKSAQTDCISPGLIGSDDNNFTTTLGREGSDYTAAIFAYCLNGNSVTIWRMPGVLNADPRHFESTQLLHHISTKKLSSSLFMGHR